MIKFVSLYLLIGVMFLSYLFIHSFSIGKTNYAKALGTLSFTLQIYLLGYLMEINSVSLSNMYFWNQVQYFGIPFFPGLWLMVSMLYTEREEYIKKYGLLLIFFIPVVTFIARTTNSYHGLYYSNIELRSFGDILIMYLEKGPLYFLQMLYVLISLLLCTFFYFTRYRNSIGDEKIQFKLLLIASVMPYVGLVLGTFNIGNVGIDYTAIILPPCVYLINLALKKYNFLEITGLAREKVFEDSLDGLILLNRQLKIVSFNDAGVVFFKWLNIELKHQSFLELVKSNEILRRCISEASEQIINISVDNELRYISVKTKNISHRTEIVGFLVTMVDVTEREQLKHQLLAMATMDELSGLYNRRKFREASQEALNRAKRYNENLSLMMLDIDFFKKINDTYGHQAGDEVIVKFSQKLKEVFSETDIIGRMGGEEFGVVMLKSDLNIVREKAEEFRKSIENQIYSFSGHEVSITVSIGISVLSEAASNLDTLINEADKALYSAKASGRNKVCL